MPSRTLLANSDANAGSNAFLSTLVSGVSLFFRDSDFAECLSFDLAIATGECCEQQLGWKKFGRSKAPIRIGRVLRQNDGPRGGEI
jgi:hypothetical protein